MKKTKTSFEETFYFKKSPQEKFPPEMDPYYPPKNPHDVADLDFKSKVIFHLESTKNTNMFFF